MQITPSRNMWKYVLKRLTQIGLIKRVTARAHHEEGTPGWQIACLKLLRDPVEHDWEIFVSTTITDSTIDDGPMGQDSEVESEKDPDAAADIEIHQGSHAKESPIKELEEENRMAPQWTSESHVNNMLFHVVNASGIQGISTKVTPTIPFVNLPADPLPGHSTTYLRR